MAPNELLVPKEILEKEFLNLAEAYGVSDIEELNKILERAVNTRNFLKGKERVEKVLNMWQSITKKMLSQWAIKHF